MNIILNDISFSYGEEKILDGITLHVRDKEHIGILGGERLR